MAKRVQSTKFEHIPIIDSNRRRGEKRKLYTAEKTQYKERTAVERVLR